MGVTPPLAYFDSCIIIYLVEEHPVYSPPLEARLRQATDTILAFSALSELECLVLPIRNRQQVLIEKFHNWFQKGHFLPLERAIFERAAELRAAHPRLKTPDAVHLAAAAHHGCAEFWTNDDRLNAIAPGLAMKVI
ncbi:MAG: PIN domain-containing protein [Acidobacteriota bacterium]|nr:PIN domain-containing protein [Acidobacteriota bacterium]